MGPHKTCNLESALQRHFVEIYYVIVVTQLRGFIMILYSFTLRAIYENGKYKTNIKSLKLFFGRLDLIIHNIQRHTRRK